MERLDYDLLFRWFVGIGADSASFTIVQDRSQRMIAPHPRLQVDVAEQLARSIVAAAHAPSPNLVGANESRSPIGGEYLF
ncbi:hypothetical protein ACVIHH_008285 [Bradyrhizobium sp. USDA 4518]